ncbi:alpha-amylase family glycosyl hydrolase [Candidatus Uabimicrobium amorphum]|uniref:Glycogen operon protein GlgX homolog n=1 Tax=Uabimicrobium amorphum TaxID=2596890 RepID=A0A5S9IL98_UABAM|nr:alpha-amylase family glycosyl hydrolase [Candidatus Uabimicrobium amorphum]BBM83597.1 glycogen operon protein GlgX homolog [Candidatus Uabimicrobium amorphum]
MTRVLLITLFAIATVCADFANVETAASSEEKYGAHIDAANWVHFVVYSPNAQQVDLLLFSAEKDQKPSQEIPMEKHGDNWKIKVRGQRVGEGLLYMYRAKGAYNVRPGAPFGLSFNDTYYLNDPYSYLNQNVSFSRVFLSIPYGDSDESVYAGGGKSIVYDHRKDTHPGYVKIPHRDLIVYELHVQDYTARIQSLDRQKRGTYLGLATPGLRTPGGLSAGLDHLVELGVNAVELMPVMEYDEETGNLPDRYNHWGYMTTNFFTPEARYASRKGQQVVELKKLIRELHKRKIAVFMDVVYNHTAEQSPWEHKNRLAVKYYNFMGLCNTEIYRSTANGKYYFNNTGTGNDVTFFGGNRFTKRWTNDSLAMWYKVYGVDGFRFDLARILADGSGNAADWVDNDPRFQGAHLHAEPWDLGGQWWNFMDSGGWNYSNNRWTKWLGRYRDHMRRFSASGMKDRSLFKRLIEGRGATSTAGESASSKPWRSINMLTCHDGYTLRDVVYFNDADGSHNCWDSNGDENLRREREKLMMGVLLTSQGVPLILQGDEFGRTKSGAQTQSDAHNTYNYESKNGASYINNVNWIDWNLKDGNTNKSPNGPRYGRELFHWTKNLISLRKKWTHFRRDHFPTYADNSQKGSSNNAKYTYTWENKAFNTPTQLSVVWWGKQGEPDLMLIYNENWEDFTVGNLGDWSQGDWKVLARSWYGEKSDFVNLDNWQQQPNVGGSFTVKARSMAILVSDND